MRSRGMVILIAALACILLTPGMLSAQSVPSSNMTVTHPSAFAVSPPLSQISQQALPTAPTIVPLRSQLRPMAPGGAAAARQADEALQTTVGDPLELDDDGGGKAHFPGVGANGYAPSDANLAVGPNHVVQMVNTEIAVYDKSGNIFPNYPQTIGSLFANLGGGCAGEWGDPIVQYDKAADRWLISQLGSFSAPYLWCVAVSTTNNPTGAYYLYSYSFDNFENLGANFLPDYPKVAVWPTSTNSAYLATYNLYTNGASAYGAALCAYDRAAMIAGAPSPASICSTIYLDISFLPSDLDGSTLPPAGSPAYFLTWETATTLRYYAMSPNFANPGSSTLSAATDIPVAALSLACGGGTCIPQANTTQQLDSLGDRVMYRMAYRNYGDHEAMVVSQAVTAGSSVGVRWYELRPVNGAFTVYQQGTFAPDSNYRWMSSAAMDQAGDIAIGYSVSSSTMFPAIRYTGRLASDPLGAMRSENSLLEGTGSQVGLSRWGDYSAMRIDPSDDCTFWYTNQYIPTSGSFNWATFVGSFKLSACSAPAQDFSISGSPGSQAVVQGNGANYTATVAPSGGFTGGVTLSVSGLPSGATATFSPNPITGGSGGSTMSVTTSANTPVGSYALMITGNSGALSHSTTVTLVVNAAATPDFAIAAAPSSQAITQGTQGSYMVTVTASNGFTGSVTLSATGLPSGAGATFSPATITGGSGGSTMTTSTNTPPGTYTVTITGTSGNVTHTTTVTLTVNSSSQSFSVSASPTSRTVTQGSSASYTATVAPSGGFTGSVTLSVSGLPTNARATFSSNPISGGSGNSTMRVTTSSSTPTGNYTLTITGTSGSITQSTAVTLVVNSFSISVSPSSQTVTRGNTTAYTVNVTAINGFNGTVSLRARSLPANSSASFSPSSIRGSGTSTMTVTTTTSTPTGTFNVAVRGSSSNLTLTSTVRLVVQ
jgi:uncharacterized membrane protein